MRLSAAYYQTETTIRTQLPCLTDAQQRGLTWWVQGAILAGSACQTAVITALCAAERERHAVRQYLREWLYDGEDKAAPCATQVDVRACFAPLLRWVLVLWKGDNLALAVDATTHGQAITALVVSVLYRGTAIPVGAKNGDSGVTGDDSGVTAVTGCCGSQYSKKEGSPKAVLR
ncbi:MAG: hypothetical protein ACR2JC_04945 [Chloroflexota bacterium]